MYKIWSYCLLIIRKTTCDLGGVDRCWGENEGNPHVHEEESRWRRKGDERRGLRWGGIIRCGWGKGGGIGGGGCAWGRDDGYGGG